MTVRVTLTPRLFRVKERTWDADGFNIDEYGNLDLFRNDDLVGHVKDGNWVAVVIEREDA